MTAMDNKTVNKIRTTLLMLSCVALALGAIMLVYAININADHVTGLPTWMNAIVVILLFGLSISMTRSIEDEHNI
jgi:Na+/alanine symporter